MASGGGNFEGYWGKLEQPSFAYDGPWPSRQSVPEAGRKSQKRQVEVER
jgi:hypothetical protein